MGGVTGAPPNHERLNARLWDGKSPQAVELGVAGFGPVGFRGDGTPIQLVADHERRTLTLMDLKAHRTIHRFEVPARWTSPTRGTNILMPVAMTPDGSVIGEDQAGGRQTGPHALERSVRPAAPLFPGEVTAAALAPDGSLVAAGDQHGDIRVWDVASGEAVAGSAWRRPASRPWRSGGGRGFPTTPASRSRRDAAGRSPPAMRGGRSGPGTLVTTRLVSG